MASVTLNGNTYTDDANAATGLANGGHRVRFVPCLSDFLAEAAIKLAAIDAAADSADAAAALAAASIAASTAAASGYATTALGHANSADASRISAAASAASAQAYVGVAQADLRATSTTSLTIGTGSKTLTVQTGKGFYAGCPLQLWANDTSYMSGVVTAYNAGTGSLTASITGVTGTGTFASWTAGPLLVSGGGSGGVDADEAILLSYLFGAQ